MGVAPDRLTPRGIALGHLIKLYADLEEDDTFRDQLAITLVEQISQAPALSVIEPGLSALRSAIAYLPMYLAEQFDKSLRATTEPDDLWDLMGALHELLQPACEGQVVQLERSSLLGLYVRRIHLAFHNTSFEEICTLVGHFGQWVVAVEAGPSGGDPHSPRQAGVSRRDAIAALPPDPPAWAHVLPASQLEQHVHDLVRRVEEGAGELPEGSLPLKAQVAQLLALAPHVPQVHYLQLLCHLQDRSYEEALDSFHRYFDRVRASTAVSPPPNGGAPATKEMTRAPIQWASLNLARLQLAFSHREQALAAIQEAVRSAQQEEDNVCLAYALLWMYHAQAGAGADAWGSPLIDGDDAAYVTSGPLSAAASAQRQQALLQRCLARAHELGLSELAALASEALALRSMDASARNSAGSEPVTTSATPEPTVSVGRAPVLPLVPLSLPGALPAMPAAQPPPLHTWSALRCGAESCGGSVPLVRACAWEHFGDVQLASLSASLQLRFHTQIDGPAHTGVTPPNHDAAAGQQRLLSLGQDQLRPTLTDRVLAACKLALLAMPKEGEAAALRILLTLRARCEPPPLHSLWLQHTAEVLTRGALLRGERRRASELLEQQKAVLAATDGPSDAVWESELELLLQKGELMQALLTADEMSRRPATGRGGGAASPKPNMINPHLSPSPSPSPSPTPTPSPGWLLAQDHDAHT